MDAKRSDRLLASPSRLAIARRATAEAFGDGGAPAFRRAMSKNAPRFSLSLTAWSCESSAFAPHPTRFRPPRSSRAVQSGHRARQNDEKNAFFSMKWVAARPTRRPETIPSRATPPTRSVPRWLLCEVVLYSTTTVTVTPSHSSHHPEHDPCRRFGLLCASQVSGAVSVLAEAGNSPCRDLPSQRHVVAYY